MDYIDSVKIAIDYIENHLQEEMTTEEVARFSGFSPYHFHRIFQSITRNSINEYVRRRRLTHSAYELFYSNTRIVELAISIYKRD
ncbi:AraC family transcriptional regulator [Paenibacillus apiarius]